MCLIVVIKSKFSLWFYFLFIVFIVFKLSVTTVTIKLLGVTSNIYTIIES